jgi:hypothetical protein
MKMKEREADEAAPEPVRRQLTEREQAALRKHKERLNDQPAAPRLKVEKSGKGTAVSIDHPNEDVGTRLLMEALGTADLDFCVELLKQVGQLAAGAGEVNAGKLNFMLAVIKGIKPNDQLEAMLAAQMAGVHLATMTFTQRLASAEDIPQQDSAERAVNKLARTFTTQMDALKRYRTGGEQTVTVQHVSVGEGGQAIVGNVTQTAPKTTPEEVAAKPPALTDAGQIPMAPIIHKTAPESVAVGRRRKRNDDE